MSFLLHCHLTAHGGGSVPLPTPPPQAGQYCPLRYAKASGRILSPQASSQALVCPSQEASPDHLPPPQLWPYTPHAPDFSRHTQEEVGEGQTPDLPEEQYLGKSHKEELVVGESHSRQLLLLPVLSQPRLVSLGLDTGAVNPPGPSHPLHPALFRGGSPALTL